MKPKQQKPNVKAPGIAKLKPPNDRRRQESQPNRKHKWLFRIAAFAVPLVFLLLLELVLRLGGYGYSTGFFLKDHVRGREVLIENQKVTWRYFSPALARSPQPTLIDASKPPDTCRIFLFGESAAMGDPEPAFGFGRILEVLLRERYPGKRFEVVNVAITAINSHVIREIAHDCGPRQGDLWIIYMGNNEVVGPFGAGTIFGAQIPNLTFIRATLALKKARGIQLLDAMRRHLSAGGPAEWEGMEMFLKQQIRRDNRGMEVVYHHFQKNLEDILNLASACGARVLLSTVASNLKDCPPFASLHRPDLTEPQRAEWERFYTAGTNSENAANYSAALGQYEQAGRIDDQFAELLFRVGRCQEAMSQYAAARESFAKARDLDTLRFRADTRINTLIRNAATSRKLGDLRLFDAVEFLVKQSTNSIPGEDWFYEHVHLNFQGNYQLARAFAEQIESAWHGLLGGTSNTASFLSSDECARRLAYTDWDRDQILEEMSARLRQPPFTYQIDHQMRMARLEQARAALRPAATGPGLQKAAETYRYALSVSPGDWVLHENFAKLLQSSGDPRGAEEQWRKVIDLVPHDEQAYYSLGNVLDGEGKSAEALEYLRHALDRRPDSLEARNGLGLALANQGKPVEAMREYEAALRRKPQFAEARVNLGQLLAEQGKTEEAKAQYREALQANSNNVAAHINLGKLLAKQNDIAGAVEQYQAALAIKPDNAIAHYNLGNALANQGRVDESMAQFAEAVRCQPGFAEARHNLGLELAKRGRTSEAVEQFAEAVRLKPQFIEARLNLGVALAKERRFEEAITSFQEVLRLDPANPSARKFLDQVLAMKSRGGTGRQE